jgi:glycosyltransferase involved in cell wall biosynthesis
MQSAITSRVIACDTSGHADDTNATVLARKWPVFLGRTDIAQWLQQLEVKPNLIHIHGLRCYHNAQAAAWAARNKIPMVVTPHAQLMPFTMARNALQKNIYDTFVERPLLARANAVHFVSQVERHDSAYAQITANKSVVVPIGMNRAQWVDIAPQIIDALDNTLNNTYPLIAFFGYLSYRKGLDLLIDALPAILARQPNARLVIAGGDPENISPELQQRANALGISSSITWLPNIARAQARWLLERADCFALPSRAESFSIGILEALSLGTPVVASRESTWDTLQQQGFGFNCSLTAPSVAQCILQVLDTDRAIRQQQRAAIAARIQSEFTWDICGAKMMNLYQQLLAQ